jgi:hypothetical protein
LNVLITIDTEIECTIDPGSPPAVEDALRRRVYCDLPRGEVGLRYQIETFNRFELKAVFFVEALFASAVGLEPLREIVDLVQSGGHEVQLHVHSEWLQRYREPGFDGRTGQNLFSFSEAEQTRLIARALDNLRQAGAERICAFRAGNYGADRATLRAVAANGLRYDTSYNYPYLGSLCRIETAAPLRQPQWLEGVVEVPITFFEDYPGHVRPTQLCACSFDELSAMLDQAERQGRPTFVIVSHSFELLNGTRTRPSRVLIDRFERLCAYLAGNRDRFRTIGFDDLELAESGQAPDCPHLVSHAGRTARRLVEQSLSTYY